LLPLQLPLALHEEAPDDDHESDVPAPSTIDAGVALIETVGSAWANAGSSSMAAAPQRSQ
jgi:hypothetical protein